MQTYTAIVKQNGGYFYGWIEEVPGVNCQEKTHSELLASLKTCLKEALDFNKKDALREAVSDYSEELVTV